MTDKEKDMNNIIMSYVKFGQNRTGIHAYSNNDIEKYLTQPSIDDAIAVVERLAYKHCPHGEYDNLVIKEILLEVYTALKGLKEVSK